MRPIERIVFTADLLRETCKTRNPDRPAKAKAKVEGFHRLLSWQLAQASGLQVDVITRFEDRQIFRLNDCEPTVAGWAQLSERTRYHPDSLNLLERLFGNSLIIGYELPRFLVKMFDDLGFALIDFVIHPVRFLEDLFLAMRTNSPAVYEQLLKYRLSESYYYLNSGLWRAHSTVNFRDPLDDNSLLFLGQTNIDRSLIGKGKILGLFDFIQRFEEMGGDHSRIYYKRHPMVSDDQEVLAYLESRPEVQRIDQNIYLLLGRDELVKVSAISSSALHEARYFGKQVEYLLPPRHTFAGEGFDLCYDRNKYVPIFGNYFNPTFWRDVLRPIVPTRTCPDVSFVDSGNRLRQAFDLYWGYPRPG